MATEQRTCRKDSSLVSARASYDRRYGVMMTTRGQTLHTGSRGRNISGLEGFHCFCRAKKMLKSQDWRVDFEVHLCCANVRRSTRSEGGTDRSYERFGEHDGDLISACSFFAPTRHPSGQC